MCRTWSGMPLGTGTADGNSTLGKGAATVAISPWTTRSASAPTKGQIRELRVPAALHPLSSRSLKSMMAAFTREM